MNRLAQSPRPWSSPGWWGWVGAAVGLFCVVPAGCRRTVDPPDQQPEPQIRVTVVLHPQLRLDRPVEDLQQHVLRVAVRRLRAAPRLPVPTDPGQPLDLAFHVDLSEDLGRLVVDERARLRHERIWPLTVDRRREVPVPPSGVDLGATLASGVEAALELLGEMTALFQADSEHLRATAARQEAHTDLRSLAVRILQDRKIHTAMPDLVELFPQAPSGLRLTILDAAAVLAEPASLGRLLRHIDGRRVEEVTRALRAAAIVGGQDAREFTSWLASGHPEERVRQAALEAYQQIEKTTPTHDSLELGLADAP